MSNTFWDWALEAYARPGAAEACLALQDDHGQSVPYLLWAAWAAPEEERLRSAAHLAARWEAVATGPLRAARRGLKAPVEGMTDGAREALRAEVKALELRAEQALMLALEALAPPPAGPPVDLAQALAAAVRAWATPAPAQALQRLARALGNSP